MNADDIVRALGGTPPVRDENPYNPTRFPYTYAYDYLRLAGVAETRADAAVALAQLCVRRGIDRDVACISLAYAYMNHYGIRKPLVAGD